VIVNRCIGKIIARELSLVASRLYRMAVSRPQSRVTVTPDSDNRYLQLLYEYMSRSYSRSSHVICITPIHDMQRDQSYVL